MYNLRIVHQADVLSVRQCYTLLGDGQFAFLGVGMPLGEGLGTVIGAALNARNKGNGHQRHRKDG